MPYYKKQDYVRCRTLDLLTYIDQNPNETYLKVNTSLVELYSLYPLDCCYSNVTRGNEDSMDNDIR